MTVVQVSLTSAVGTPREPMYIAPMNKDTIWDTTVLANVHPPHPPQSGDTMFHRYIRLSTIPPRTCHVMCLHPTHRDMLTTHNHQQGVPLPSTHPHTGFSQALYVCVTFLEPHSRLKSSKELGIIETRRNHRTVCWQLWVQYTGCHWRQLPQRYFRSGMRRRRVLV